MLSVLTRLWQIWLGVSLDRGPIDIRGYLRRLRSFTIKPPPLPPWERESRVTMHIRATSGLMRITEVFINWRIGFPRKKL